MSNRVHHIFILSAKKITLTTPQQKRIKVDRELLNIGP